MPFVIPQVLNMMNVLMVHAGIHGIYTYIFTYMYLNNLYIHLIISNSIESRKFFGISEDWKYGGKNTLGIIS